MSVRSSSLNIPTAEVFEPLCQPSRYKGAYGGRAGGKSTFFGEKLIDDSLEGGVLSVCIREVQKTLRYSAKRLIERKLLEMGLSERHGFKVFNDVIETPKDGVILFQGMQDHTAESIKSLDDFHRAWVEEAQTLSSVSLRMLRPSIRGKDSEIWFSWNPRRKMDPVDLMFRSRTPPTNSILVHSNWNNNPWFPPEMEQERLDCLETEPEQYGHVWEGDYVGVSKGAYFAKHLAQAKAEHRIGNVHADPLLPVGLFVDIGGTGAKSDAFAIWVAQFVGTEIRLLNYYEAQGQDIATHLAWLREKDYTPANAQIWLPHDGKTNDRIYDVSYESAFKASGYEVTVVPNQGKGAAAKRIEEVRRLFPSMYFDAVRCEAGLESLSWYHEKIDEVRNIGLGPEHDWASHGSDAFGLMCIVHSLPPAQSKPINYAGWG